jgi:Lambda phage tail tube protein, TTP
MAILGFGCDLLYSTNGGGSYTTFGQITEFDLPDIEIHDVDTSNIEMANAWRTFQPGLIDGKTVKFKLIFAKAQYNAILGQLRNFGSNFLFKIVFSDVVSTASTGVFAGYIRMMGGAAPLDDQIVCNVEIKISGILTFTPGT